MKRNIDTVPAMLTPGEGVLNNGAMDIVGRPFVRYVNALGMQRGGVVPGYALGTDSAGINFGGGSGIRDAGDMTYEQWKTMKTPIEQTLSQPTSRPASISSNQNYFGDRQTPNATPMTQPRNLMNSERDYRSGILGYAYGTANAGDLSEWQKAQLNAVGAGQGQNTGIVKPDINVPDNRYTGRLYQGTEPNNTFYSSSDASRNAARPRVNTMTGMERGGPTVNIPYDKGRNFVDPNFLGDVSNAEAKGFQSAMRNNIKPVAKQVVSTGLSKAGSMLGRYGGPAASIALEAPQVYADVNTPGMTEDDKRERMIESGTRLAGAGLGGSAGSTLGTAIFPGVGTAIGGLIGGGLGYLMPEAVQKGYQYVTGKNVSLPSQEAEARRNGAGDMSVGSTPTPPKTEQQPASAQKPPVEDFNGQSTRIEEGIRNEATVPTPYVNAGERQSIGTLTTSGRAGNDLGQPRIAPGSGAEVGVTGYDPYTGKPIMQETAPHTYNIENGKVTRDDGSQLGGTFSQGGMFGADWKKNTTQYDLSQPQGYGMPQYMPQQPDYTDAINQLMQQASVRDDRFTSIGEAIANRKQRESAIKQLGALITAQGNAGDNATRWGLGMQNLGLENQRNQLYDKRLAQQQAQQQAAGLAAAQQQGIENDLAERKFQNEQEKTALTENYNINRWQRAQEMMNDQSLLPEYRDIARREFERQDSILKQRQKQRSTNPLYADETGQ